jgi:hypothetical protein
MATVNRTALLCANPSNPETWPTRWRISAWGRVLHESENKAQCERLAIRLRNEGYAVRLERVAIEPLPDDKRVRTSASRIRNNRALHMLQLAAIGGAS